MSEVIQNDDVPAGNNAPHPEDQNITGSDLAPDTEGQQEPNAQVDEEAEKKAAAQKAIDERIGKVTFQAKQAERERDEANAKLEQIENARREQEAAQAGQLPPWPDELDDDFEQKKQAYTEAIRKNADYEASSKAYDQQIANQQQQEAQQQQLAFQQTVQSFSTRAKELEIDPNELQSMVNQVVSYGLPEQLGSHILADKDGPLLTKYLAANPMDAMNLANMSVYQQGAYLEGIRAKAEALKPKQSTTPDPPDNLSGNGAEDRDLNKFPNSKGAKFY